MKTINDIGITIYQHWLTPLAESIKAYEFGHPATFLNDQKREEGQRFLLEWFERPGLDINHTDPHARAAAVNLLTNLSRRAAADWQPLPEFLESADPVTLARVLVRAEILRTLNPSRKHP